MKGGKGKPVAKTCDFVRGEALFFPGVHHKTKDPIVVECAFVELHPTGLCVTYKQTPGKSSGSLMLGFPPAAYYKSRVEVEELVEGYKKGKKG